MVFNQKVNGWDGGQNLISVSLCLFISQLALTSFENKKVSEMVVLK